jgi:hypothetical protein
LNVAVPNAVMPIQAILAPLTDSRRLQALHLGNGNKKRPLGVLTIEREEILVLTAFLCRTWVEWPCWGFIALFSIMI